MTQTLRALSRIVLTASVAATAGACDGSRSTPTAPVGIPPPPAPTQGAFYGESVVESVSGTPFCPDTVTAGDVYTGMRWDEVVVRSGTFLIAYDEFWVNGYDTPRYEGPLNGLQFAAEYRHPEPDTASCRFRESWVSGSFSSDFRSFEMRETKVFGPSGNEYRIVYLHRASAKG